MTLTSFLESHDDESHQRAIAKDLGTILRRPAGLSRFALSQSDAITTARALEWFEIPPLDRATRGTIAARILLQHVANIANYTDRHISMAILGINEYRNKTVKEREATLNDKHISQGEWGGHRPRLFQQLCSCLWLEVQIENLVEQLNAVQLLVELCRSSMARYLAISYIDRRIIPDMLEDEGTPNRYVAMTLLSEPLVKLVTTGSWYFLDHSHRPPNNGLNAYLDVIGHAQSIHDSWAVFMNETPWPSAASQRSSIAPLLAALSPADRELGIYNLARKWRDPRGGREIGLSPYDGVRFRTQKIAIAIRRLLVALGACCCEQCKSWKLPQPPTYLDDVYLRDDDFIIETAGDIQLVLSRMYDEVPECSTGHLDAWELDDIRSFCRVKLENLPHLLEELD